MSMRLLFNLDGNAALFNALLKRSAGGLRALAAGELELRRFPDGESYLRVLSEVKGAEVFILCSLAPADSLIMPLVLLCETLREMAVSKIVLLAPYLGYMRQDKQFKSGEAVSSRHFARLLSRYIDRLITVDPHLHRYHSLDQIYSVPSQVLHAEPLISAWIKANIAQPVLIGPDSESEQWVKGVADDAGAPFMILEKMRHGDRNVSVSAPDAVLLQNRVPILVDDIISSGHTMLETVAHLRAMGSLPPVCIGVHGIFAEQADQKLMAAGVAQLVTSNALPHASNQICLAQLLVDAL
ncbi:MAG TPA: ribose-phosphate diphosphokinase [Pseudomonadales bacterium]|nr:ribose-phosphate diphosphokinase [Pseudomonadales bacterium]